MNEQERNSTIDRLFLEALNRPRSEWPEFLANACVDLPDDIHREVILLLESDYELEQQSRPFLAYDSPAAPSDAGLGSVSQDPNIGSTISHYTIERRLGSGGFGVVYLARRSDEFEQNVALKLIQSKHALDRSILRRFELERQVLSDLNHPNIARLLDGGSTIDGQPYFVMEYVDGAPINKHCDELQLPLADRLKLFHQVCLAVAHAHQFSVIHRDLKPANILIDTDGTPKLVDFGIAKILAPKFTNEPNSVTVTGQLIMTPEYASPEQINGQPQGMASDVYSLGVVLYELLVGTRPYNVCASSTYEWVRLVNEATPQKPSQAVLTRNPSPNVPESDVQTRTSKSRPLRGDLDNIVLKALRKDSTDRYPSAQDLADDIQRYFDGLPVEARRGSTTYRIGKLVRRHRWTTAVSAIACMLLVVAAVNVVVSSRQAIESAKAAMHSLYEAKMTIAFKEWDAGNLPAVDTVLREYLPLKGQTDLRDDLWFLLAAEYMRNEPEVVADADSGGIAAFDGHSHFYRFAKDGASPTAAYYQGVDVRTHEVKQLFRVDADIKQVSRDGSTVVTYQSNTQTQADEHGTPPTESVQPIRVTCVIDRPMADSIPCDIALQQIAISRSGRRLGGCSAKGEFRFWDLETGSMIRTAKADGHVQPPRSGHVFVFSDDDRYAAYLSEKSDVVTLHILDLESDLEHTIEILGQTHVLRFQPGARRLLVGGETMRVVDFSNEIASVGRLRLEGLRQCRSMEVSATGNRLVTSSEDGSVTVWDLKSEESIAKKYLEYFSTGLHFDRAESKVLGFSEVGVWSWSFEEVPDVSTTNGFTPTWMESYSVLDSSGLAAFAGNRRQMIVWDAKSAAAWRFGSQAARIVSTAVSPDGKLAALGDDLGFIEIWTIADRELKQRMQRTDPVEKSCITLEFSPDSARLISGGKGSFSGWDVESGERLWQRENEGWTYLTEFDGRGRLYTGGVKGSLFDRRAERERFLVQIWEESPSGLKLLQELPHQKAFWLTALAISSDDRMLATADQNEIRIYELPQRGRPEYRSLGRHQTRISSLCFSSDGQTLFSGSKRGVVVWRVDSGQEITRLYPDQDVNAVEMISAANGMQGLLIGFRRDTSPDAGDVLMHWIDRATVNEFWMKRHQLLLKTE